MTTNHMQPPAQAPWIWLDTEATRLRAPYFRHGRRTLEWYLVRVEPDGTERVFHRFVRIRDLRLRRMLPWRWRIFAFRLAWIRYSALPADVQKAFEINGFHERHPQRGGHGPVYKERDVARELFTGLWLRPYVLPDGRRVKPLVFGRVVNFDMLNLHDLGYRCGFLGPDDEPYDYRPYDVTTMAGSALNLTPPYVSTEIQNLLGVDPTQFALHTAGGDVALDRVVYARTRALQRTYGTREPG